MNMTQNTSRGQESAGWPGGWYIFNNGKVEGPYTASQAFEMDTMSGEGKPLLVSRKGFTQWYALKDLAEIFKITEGLGRRVAIEKAELQRTGKTPAGHVKTPPETSSAPVSMSHSGLSSSGHGSRIVKKHVGPKIQKIAGALEYMPPAGATDVEVKVQTAASVSDSSAEPVTEVGSTAESAQRSEGVEPSRKQLFQEYFFLKGRLRLGKLRNPWASAFFGIPVTIGILWPVWVHALLSEVFYHSANKTRIPRWVVLFSVIPGLHLFAVYQLAVFVREMELQNRYKSISPFLATIFGIFPPFAMAYLQDGANRHWMLHARHAGVPKK